MGKLLKLATMIEFDGSGTLTIRNGEARISLGSDGVVRVEGKNYPDGSSEYRARRCLY